jgi:hypothetical protein
MRRENDAACEFTINHARTRQIQRPHIDAQQASIDTESEMVSMHACAETHAAAAAASGWHASPGWAMGFGQPVKNTGHSGRKL